VDFSRHLFRPDNRDHQIAPANRRSEYQAAVSNCFGCRIEDLGIVEDNVRAAGRGTCFRIGPAIARAHQPHFGQPEVEHCPRSFADILAELRTNEDDNGWFAAHSSFV
jgi:hypothetical protein